MTPRYVFDIKELNNRIQMIRNAFCNIPLTYSIKANPFLIEYMPNDISHIEACSPGELDICIEKGIDPSKIIYSGVMKEYEDTKRAVEYGSEIITIESFLHYKIIKQISCESGRKITVIIRLTSGNQFGMDKDDILSLVGEILKDDVCQLKGFHYYSGTQKSKKADFEKDVSNISELITEVKSVYDYSPALIEYGPGLAVDYFIAPHDQFDRDTLSVASEVINGFSKEVPLTIEMGRFIASTCGRFETSVKDIKTNKGINYAIVDGGIHHVNYYKQIMSMNKPPLSQSSEVDGVSKKYTICGSLCTVADLLVKDIELKELHVGDVLTFYRVGAYSVCESPALFLSRKLPFVYVENENNELIMVRDNRPTSAINSSIVKGDQQ